MPFAAAQVAQMQAGGVVRGSLAPMTVLTLAILALVLFSGPTLDPVAPWAFTDARRDCRRDGRVGHGKVRGRLAPCDPPRAPLYRGRPASWPVQPREDGIRTGPHRRRPLALSRGGDRGGLGQPRTHGDRLLGASAGLQARAALRLVVPSGAAGPLPHSSPLTVPRSHATHLGGGAIVAKWVASLPPR